MEYFSHKINLGDNQIKKLRKLNAVTIKHPQIGSGLTIYLGGPNHKKVMKAHRTNKNHRLKLTPDELDLNEKEGSGFFKFLHKVGVSRNQFNKGAKAVAKVAAPIVESIAKPVGAAAASALATAAGNPELIPIAAPIGAAIASQGSKALTNYANGKGIKDFGNQIVNPIKKVFRPVLGKGVEFTSRHPTQIHSSTVLGGQLHPYHTFSNGYYNTLPMSSPAMHPFIESGLKYVGGRGFQASGY